MKNPLSPPRFARWLLKRLVHSSERRSILSDFYEIYEDMGKIQGKRKAVFWYWAQTIKSMPKFLKTQWNWSFAMGKNYIKMSFRSFRKNKVFSSINLAGLSLGIACCLLIMLWVFDEQSYDRFHEGNRNIYRVTQEHKYEGHSATTYLPLGVHLKLDFPEIEKCVRFCSAKGTFRKDNEDSFKEDGIFYADKDFFGVFSFPLLMGDGENALQEPNSVVLTEDLARKYFGNREPLGQIIMYKNLEYSQEKEKPLKVTAVLENIPLNSHIKFDALVSINTFDELKGFEQYGWHWPPIHTYVRLTDPGSLGRIESQMKAFGAKYLPKAEDEVRTFHFQPLTKIHLNSHLKYELEANGNESQVHIYSIVAILVILIACVNYVNLSTALAAKRGREVGIKKVLGARTFHLVIQFIGNSFVFVSAAFLLAVGIVFAILPYFNDLFGKEMNLSETVRATPVFIGLQVGLLILIIVLVGIYPAVLMSRFHPIQALKNHLQIRGGRLRKVLVIAQFAISIILISGTAVIIQQLDFIRNRNLGFEQENILVVPLWGEKIVHNLGSLKERLLLNPNVLKYTEYSNVIGANDRIYAYPIQGEGIPEDKQLEMSILVVDYDFIETFGLEIMEGRAFSDKSGTDREGLIVNETARDLLKYSDPIGRKLEVKFIKKGEDHKGRIIGVVKDFNIRTLHHRIEPLLMFVADRNDSDYLMSTVSLKINANSVPETLEYIRDQWSVLESRELFEYSFLDERIGMQYANEEKAQKLIMFFSVVSVLIACFGLYGLSAFLTESRTKEIGIRRILGAPVGKMTAMLNAEFLKWVLAATIAAIPLAYFALSTWLNSFAFRIELGVLPFLIAGALAMFIALLTVSFHTLRAASANPAETLRYE